VSGNLVPWKKIFGNPAIAEQTRTKWRERERERERDREREREKEREKKRKRESVLSEKNVDDDHYIWQKNVSAKREQEKRKRGYVTRAWSEPKEG
jgi:hypothetical protein